jgi:hypothetical protein
MTCDARAPERGTALVVAVVLVLLLSAAGLGLALTSALEPSITRYFETGNRVANVAESAVVLAAHEVAGVADWTPVLRGDWPSALLDAAGDGTVVSVSPPAVTAGVLTSRASCGRETPCSDADTAEVTEDRPWGSNNPRFRLLGVLRGERFGGEPALAPYVAAVWVGDDPAEADGDPVTDGGAPAPWPAGIPQGQGRMLIRAEAFGPGGVHRTAQATLERGTGLPRLRAWIVQ